MTDIKLHGKFFISGTITAKSGLYIGGTNIGLEIGGADMVVVRDKVTNKPYIPGSSLKGSIRSLLERNGKENGLSYQLKAVVGITEEDRMKKVMIHICEDENSYKICPICNVFGISADQKFETMPTRLIVRDAPLNDAETNLKDNPNTDMPYTEVKTEVVIDRLTSKATPRQLERVPAGAEFRFEMVYNVYSKEDVDWLKQVFVGMDLLEGDFLGGQGSRGSGQIRFGKFERDNETNEPKFEEPKEKITLEWKSSDDYLSGKEDKAPIGKFLVKEWKKNIEQNQIISSIKCKI